MSWVIKAIQIGYDEGYYMGESELWHTNLKDQGIIRFKNKAEAQFISESRELNSSSYTFEVKEVP